MSLALKLFGLFQVTYEGRPLKFATDSTRALLAYLVVEADRPHARTTLATLLWPEERESAARQNLRQALVFLKQGLQKVPERDQLLHITATTVEWRSQQVTVDFYHLHQLHRLCQTCNHAELRACPSCIERMSEAVTRCGGEFLDGLLLKQSQPFEEWSLFLREQTHRQVAEMLETLAAYHLAHGNYDQAQQLATRLVTLEPWHEAAHRQLMQALAAQGQPSAALRQYESCRRTLQEELGVPPSPETVSLYEQIRRGKWGGESAALQQSTVPSLYGESLTALPIAAKRYHNLPSFLAPLFGRTAQLAQLRALIDNPAQRLITIVGMGGMGKTRLALALLEQLMAESPLLFGDGVWFVPLVGVSASASDLPAALAGAALSALDVKTPSPENQQTTLIHHLATRHLLLLFDNLEHLLLEERGAGATLEFLLALLQAAPQVRLLTTSRLPLQHLAESVIRLDGLPVPLQRGSTAELDEAHYVSVRLFAHHAQRATAYFSLGDDNLPAVSELCRMLGGMPLAIELAAALTPHFTCAELVAAIRQNLALLVSTRRDIDVRHRHFHALLTSAWQQLSDREQRILAASSVFVGHFSRAAVQAVTGATLADLTSLLDKSLIQQTEVGEYQLHELLRQFAGDILQRNGTAMQVANQHSRYYLNFAAECHEALARHAPRQAAAVIQHELDNLRQAWSWTVAHLDQRHLSSELRDRLDRSANALWQFYLFACLYEEGGAAFQQAVAKVQTVMASTLARASVPDEEEDERLGWQRLLSKLLAFAAMIECFQGKLETGRLVAERAVALSIGCGNRVGEIAGLEALMHLSYLAGHFAETKEHGLQILCRVQAFGSNPGDAGLLPNEVGYSAQSTACIYLGAIAKIDDDYAQAAAYFRRALEVCQASGKVMGILDARMNLADLARNKQNYAAARPEYEEVVQLACEVSNRRAEGIARYELGDVLRGLGHYSLALTQFSQALALFAEIGDPLLQTYATSSLAALYTVLGTLERATEALQAAFRYSEPLTMPDAKPSVWLAAALLCQQQGEYEQALHYAISCREDGQRHNSRHTEAIACFYLGLAWEGLARWSEAEAAFQSALELYRALDLLPAGVDAQAGLARVALAQGDRVRALGWVEQLLVDWPAYPNVGQDEPFLIYLTCYQVFHANDDPRAQDFLVRGDQELLRYAEQFTDPALRQSFLANVPVHAALLQAAESHKPSR